MIGRVVAFLLLFVAVAHAEPVVSLPLDGYYRPGKFFPVKIESDRDVIVEVTADAVSSRGAGRSMILPAMSVSRVPGVVKVTIDGKATELPIRPLEPQQRLRAAVGSEGPIESDRGDLWVRLAEAPGAREANAFESVDVLGPATRPSTGRGPASSLDSAAAYNAASVFGPAKSIITRRAVWLSLLLFAIMAVAASLVRWRHTAVGVAVVGVVWTIGATVVLARMPAVTGRSGWVILERSGTDKAYYHWAFRTAAAKTDDSFLVDPTAPVRPLFAGNAQSLKVRIEPERDLWRIHYTLEPNAKAIFVFEGSGEGPKRDTVEPNRTPVMMDIAKAYYVRPGDVLKAEPSFESPPTSAEVVSVKVK